MIQNLWFYETPCLHGWHDGKIHGLFCIRVHVQTRRNQATQDHESFSL